MQLLISKSSLAHVEMRIIFAKLLFNFDMELADGMEDWVKRCRPYTVWEKPALMVKMKIASS